MSKKTIPIFSKKLREEYDVKLSLENIIHRNNHKISHESYKELQDLSTILLNYAESERQKANLPDLFKNIPYHLFFDSPELKPRSSESNILYVSQENLDRITSHNSKIGQGQVLGAYDPDTDTIYILNTLRGYQHDKTLKHEQNHRKYPFASEQQIEMITSSEGYF